MITERDREEAHQMDERERRDEWKALHGDGDTLLEAIMDRTPVTRMGWWENDIDRANQKIWDLERDIRLLKGAMQYLEENKIPWLESEIRRLQDGR